MRHNLKISVSKEPTNGGIVAYHTVSIRERLLTALLGPQRRVMVLVPGGSVESIAITGIPEGGVMYE